ncbi:hypothetical protein BUALT_Bualt18G0044800 [Buddleja alternifolia]|uniref:Uncharacterized protein n=1 Tax=Buddleja alternifolia TaxID=168488 RepID=A0AAV6W8V2_9LAMI|nr:hypothetical protein BUALT_Bualt18G0044800 [Buddleja alternifolia]
MAQEEQILGCGYSGGGGSGGGGGGGGGSGCSGGGASICSSSSSRSKKVKQKKVPQRGLGVAQLEKIREEQQKKEEALQAANILAKKAIDDHVTNPSLAIQCPKFRPNLSHLPLSTTNLPSPNALFRQSPSAPNLETLHEISSVQIPKQISAGGVELGLDSNSSPGDRNWSRLWSSEHNLGGEKQMLDNHGFAFRPPQVNESNAYAPVLPLPSRPQRSHQFQHSFSFPSMVNAASGISSSSSVLSSQIEPPSNQSSRGNNYTPFWPDEDKMVGMKRSYPFSLESPPASSFNTYPSSISRSDDLALCSNRYAPQMEPRNKYIREGPSNSNPLTEQNQSEVIRDNGTLNGDFLTLAPPEVATSPPWDTKNKNYWDYSSELECTVRQENAESHNHWLGQSGSIEQSFSFFPMKLQIDRNTPQVSSGNGEKGETIDLNLKL